MYPSTKSSSTTTTITITMSTPAATSDVTECTNDSLQYTAVSIRPTSPAETEASSVSLLEVSPPKKILKRVTDSLSKIVDESNSGNDTDHKNCLTNDSMIDIIIHEGAEASFDLAKVFQLLDYIVCKTLIPTHQCKAYIVKLKEKYNGTEFVRVEERILQDTRSDIIETFTEQFYYDRMILTVESASSLKVDKILILGELSDSGAMSYLLKFSNFEKDKCYWVSEEDMETHYAELLDQFKGSLASLDNWPIIKRSADSSNALQSPTTEKIDIPANIMSAKDD